MNASRPRRVRALILLLFGVLFVAASQYPEPLEIIEAGDGTLDLDDRRAALAFSVTERGPLVALQPVVARLGGILEIGPMQQSHTLTLNQVTFVFGPQSSAVTVEQEITEISQPPQAGPGGLQVPLDLLRRTFGTQTGVDFEWRASERQLSIVRLPERVLQMTYDLVHLQGVTTLVFQFPTRPRYRLSNDGSRIEVNLVGDRLAAERSRPLPSDALVRDVRLRSDRIRVELAPGSVAQDYVLERPFRLVFDIFAGTPRAATTTPPPRMPQRRESSSGIQTIVIDPGHGGSDTGAVGRNGAEEKELTLRLARTLKRRLESRLPVKVVLTRNEDAELPLDTRSALANQFKADLFLSLHLNSSVAAGARGAETYFLSLEASDERAAEAAAAENVAGRAGAEDPLFDLQLMLWDLAQTHHLSQSQNLARLIQEELNQELDLRNRGVKQAPFRVLMGAAMPAVLIELGFLSNPAEESQLADPEYRAQLADTLVRAVTRYRAQVEGIALEDEEASP